MGGWLGAPVRGDQDYRRLLSVLLGAFAALFLVQPLLEIVHPVVLNYNEGWNAYHAAAAVRGENIYDGGGRLIGNNYPPLSFLIVGVLGEALGDNVVAGRLVAMLSFIVTIANIYRVTRRLSGDRATGAVAALFFVAFMAAYFPAYVGTNDPQMLGHALMTTALVVFCGDLPRHRRLAITAALLCAGGFVKHSLVALPVAVTLYLLLCQRRDVLAWLGYSLAFLAASFALTFAVYGTLFLDSLLAPRSYSLQALGEASRREAYRLQMPLALWAVQAVLFRHRRDTVLIALYVAAAGASAVAFSGGDGVNYNVFIDLLIALSIAVGIGLQRIATLLSRTGMTWTLVRRAMTLLSVALLLGLFIVAPVNAYKFVKRMPTLAAQVADTPADIAYLRASPDPAICVHLVLCYWAGKTFELDSHAGRQAMLLGRSESRDLFQKVRDGHFAVIQVLDPAAAEQDATIFSAALQAAASEAYEVGRTSANGFFLVRRGAGNGSGS